MNSAATKWPVEKLDLRLAYCNNSFTNTAVFVRVLHNCEEKRISRTQDKGEICNCIQCNIIRGTPRRITCRNKENLFQMTKRDSFELTTNQ